MGITNIEWESQQDVMMGPATDGYYDSENHQVTYYNQTPSGENGHIQYKALGSAVVPYWINDTSLGYPIHEHGSVGDQEAASSSFDMSSTLGLIGLVIVIMALAVIAGLRVLGTGTSEVSVSAIIKGTAFLTLWGIFSVLSLSLITTIPMLGPFFYFFLTAIYCLGIVNSIGSPSGE